MTGVLAHYLMPIEYLPLMLCFLIGVHIGALMRLLGRWRK